MTITNDQAVELVLRINQGYAPTKEEQQGLSELEKLDLRFSQVSSLEGISGLKNLQKLGLNDTQVCSLEGIIGLKKLQELSLRRTQVSSLEGISGLKNLQELWLNDTQVSSLEGISELKNLKSLDLRGTQVSSLEGISGLANLKELWLNDTQVCSLEEISGLTNLKSLDLRGTHISSLEGISGLKNLKYLWLSNTQVSSLEEISELTNLQELWLNNTQVCSLEGISGLKNLESLDLRGTQVSFLEGISGLTNLQELGLNDTQVSSLEGISGLKNLESLDLSNTQVSSLEGICGLAKLQNLYLSNTQVSSLEGISGLKNLQWLDLQGTQVSSLEKIASLPSLSILILSNTSLDRIPKQFVDRSFRFNTNEEIGWDSHCVYMKNVQLSEQPVSLFSQPRELIKAYYREKQIPVNEAKVIFLGDGGVGKTYTIYRIEHNGEKPENTETTPGVSITQHKREGKATINFWDFGGQEIMRSMHRCFLTERTCYVVTANNRDSEVTRQARRWLKIIESFAPNSKVILAVNRWEGVSVWNLDKGRLKEEFPNLLVKVVEYTATELEDIEDLTRAIEEEVDVLNSVKMKLPESWAEIMNNLRNMSGDSKNYITNEDFQKICRNAKLKADGDISLWLLEWFNDLGVCFSYHKNAKTDAPITNYKILNPIWLTNAVYIIINDGRIYAQQGRINHAALSEILADPKKGVVQGLKYRKDELDFILEVMRKYRLSFQSDGAQEFVPALCPNETPNDLRPKEYKSRVRCEVRYDYLPDNVVHRLMVDCVGKLNFEKCWLKGLCVDERAACGLVAVCDMGKDDDVLLIDVYQVEVDNKDVKPQSPQSLLRTLLNKLDKINDDLNLKATTWICSNKDPKASFQLSALLEAREQGETSVQFMADGHFKRYNIYELLGQVFDEPIEVPISTSDEGEIELNFDGIAPQYSFLKSIWTVLKPLKEKSMEKTPNEKVGNIFVVNLNGNGNSAVVGSDSSSANSEVRVVQSDSGLQKQLDEFRNELNKLEKLNEDQKELLYDAVGELIDKLNEPKEAQEKGIGKFKKLLKGMGCCSKVFEVAANLSTVADYLGITP